MAINDAGQIVGHGTFNGKAGAIGSGPIATYEANQENTRAFLLIPLAKEEMLMK